MAGMRVVLAFLAAVFLLYGCAQELEQPQSPSQAPQAQANASVPASSAQLSPADICIEACTDARASGKDLTAGPCLLNPEQQNSNWVCDIAHSPRLLVDDLRENECSSYLSEKAHHFVEVTPGCKLIREY